MRLIDCDALKIVSTGRRNRRNYVWADITAVQPIDAIPVKWIISWSNKRYRDTQRDVSIVDVLAAWKKEQEVRGT